MQKEKVHEFREEILSHHKIRHETHKEPLHNFTGLERYSFRENAHFSGIFKYTLHKPRLLHQQPSEFSRLTLGQQ